MSTVPSQTVIIWVYIISSLSKSKTRAISSTWDVSGNHIFIFQEECRLVPYIPHTLVKKPLTSVSRLSRVPSFTGSFVPRILSTNIAPRFE